MSFERAALFGIVEFHYQAPAGAVMTFYTDMPTGAVAVIPGTYNLDATTTRNIMKFRLPGATKGKLFKVRLDSTGVVWLYGVRIYGRPLGVGANWDWFPVYVPETSDAWEDIPLPIPKTGEWEDLMLPIPKTGEWEDLKIPMDPTPDLFQWVDVPVAK